MIKNKSNSLPKAYALRQALNDEVHSRPTEALWAQERVFHIAMLVERDVTQEVVDAVQPGTSLVVTVHDPPRGLLDVRVGEQGVLGA